MTTYTIRKGTRAPCELWRGDVKCAEGTYNYCDKLKELMENATN